MILEIDRSAVEMGNVASALAQLLVLTDTRENVFRYQAALTFCFVGYDEEFRELFEIPQLRAYVRELTKEWPYWLWFLKRGTNSIPLLFSFLCQIRVAPGQKGNVAEFSDGSEFVKVLDNLLERSKVLYDFYGVSESQAALSAESAIWDIFEGFA